MTQDRYTHGHHASVLRSHTWRTAVNSAAYLLPYLSRGQDLLDVGCGPASITADLATLVAPGRVIGIDNAEAVLDVARATVAEVGATNVAVRLADVYHLPFDDQSFDVVHAHQVLQHLSDPVGALREMRRVCRSDGLVAARDCDYPAMTWFPEDRRLERWMELYLEVSRSNDAEPAAGRRLKSWALQAGFTAVDTSTGSWCFATPEERAWWGGLWAERITSSALAEQALSGAHARPEELAGLAEAWRAWSRAEDGWFGVLHGEIICRP